MIKKLLFIFGLIACATLSAFARSLQDSVYHGSATIVNNLVHTKLAVSFDYAKRYLYGKAWITLRPHFYPTDTVTLDAKGMVIKNLALVGNGKNIPLKYDYNDRQLKIKLDRVYKSNEKYTLYINYISRPDELKDPGGSAAIISAKGLYFINPDGKNKDKPIEIWTQGETDANSVWFPTIDKPNQKTTSELAMTVPAKYVTLSNGRLVSQVKNSGGTRTDTWKMDLPHAPYLFMMAVGDFKIYKDNYKGKEVSYYLEPKYAPYAKQIFGNTPEMIKFYEQILGVPYQWNKYSQIVCRDYVSGAMENTTATLHGEYVHRNDRDLLDADPEDYICHELFHQWFGDLVTGESWSNITLHESFAKYSEYLWFEYKYGKDRADEHGYGDMYDVYFPQADGGGDADLVRYYYKNQEDVFDGISYHKGGRILNMLRNYVGDDAFFKSLHLYLTQNMFKTAEVTQLRLAFEEVTGKDLSWYFNQWYFGKGYPELNVSYSYDDNAKAVAVTIKQTQKGDKIFKLPFAVDIYEGGKKIRNKVMLDQREQTFTYSYTTKPDLVNVDGDRVLLAKITDNKSLGQLIFQYHHAGLYRDRRDAIAASLEQQFSNATAQGMLVEAVNDKYYGLQILAINGLRLDSGSLKPAIVPVLEKLAASAPKSTVRAAAIKKLGGLKDEKYKPLFVNASRSKSYAESAAALTALSLLDLDGAYAIAKKNEGDVKRELFVAVGNIYVKKGNVTDIPYFRDYLAGATGFDKFTPTFYYQQMLVAINNTDTVIAGLNDIKQSAIEFNNSTANKYFAYYLKQFSVAKKAKADTVADPVLKAELDKQVNYADKTIEEINNLSK